MVRVADTVGIRVQGAECRLLALPLFIWAHRFGEPRLFSAAELVNWHRTPSQSTEE